MKQLRLLPFIFLGFLFILSTLAGCGLGPRLTPQPTITPTPFPTCIPTAAAFKFFSSTDGVLGSQNQEADNITGDVYVKSLAAKRNNEIAGLDSQKSRALQFLAYETMRWSSIQNVGEGEKRVRLVATFISPELIRAVILNHVIYKEMFEDKYISGLNLSAYTNQKLRGMDERQEFLFLITIQAEVPEGSEIQIELPATSFFLKKNTSFRVPVSHTDGFFKHSLKMSSSQHTGFLYFPFGVSDKTDSCQQTLDVLHDKFIMLSVEGAIIDGKKYDEIIWQIPFVPPLDVGSAIPTPNPDLPILSNHAPASIAPPIQDIGPTGMVTALTDQNIKYWSNLGQFVWSNLTLDYFPPSK